MFKRKPDTSLVRLPPWLTALAGNWRVGGLMAPLFFSLVLGLSASASAKQASPLALTPPMGWNDWAHYQCDYTAKTILDNAHALVRTGLAARGYDQVTIDDCWMRKQRSSNGNLQPNPKKFPFGMRVVGAQIHSLGLKFGIYEDAGYATCGGFAGSGVPLGGGKAHFLQDARLFAKWGVDYLKLDGCNVYARKGESKSAAYRAAYRAEHDALQKVGRPIVFLESAPAYFQGTPDWYDVLTWAGKYGQLWREGTDIKTYDREAPNRSRFASIMWNYDYNLELGRFQRPGNWNNADFIIGGDHGVTLAQTRTQLALWSMMSAPLILSSNINKLSPAAIRVLGNRAVISVDQDPLGRMATLLQRSPVMDLLLKPLVHEDYAVAVLNRSAAPLRIAIGAAQLGFQRADCRFSVRNLWTGAQHRSAGELRADIAAHDTAIWKIRPAAQCARPVRIGTITRIVPQSALNHHIAADYTRCLTAPARVQACNATVAQSWRVTRSGALESGGKCLAQSGSRVVAEACRRWSAQRWSYNRLGNLINRASQLCLTGPRTGELTVRKCGHNLATQIWALPNGMGEHQRLL